MKKIVLCIPTLNPGDYAVKMVNALSIQSRRPDHILIIDSSSNDGSIIAYKELNAKIIEIDRNSFDHGATRNIAFDQYQADYFLFMTQDAILENSASIQELASILDSIESCGVVFGRQTPHAGAGDFASHARLYNYPDCDNALIKSIEDIPRLGIKTAFCSNSFAMYRFDAMKEINFFEEGTLFAEDSIAAAKLLIRRWSVGYAPKALVQHSHEYSLVEEFRRYFDVGAFHALNPWFIKFLGRAEGEGKKFVSSEYRYLKNLGRFFPGIRVVFRNGCRWLGYKFGLIHKFFPIKALQLMSMNKSYWKKAGVTRAYGR